MLSGEGLRAFLPRVRPRRNERRPCPAQPPLHQYRPASQRVRRHRRGFGRSDRRIYFRRDREGRQARGGLLHRRSGRHRGSGVPRRSGRHPDASRCGPPTPRTHALERIRPRRGMRRLRRFFRHRLQSGDRTFGRPRHRRRRHRHHVGNAGTAGRRGDARPPRRHPRSGRQGEGHHPAHPRLCRRAQSRHHGRQPRSRQHRWRPDHH